MSKTQKGNQEGREGWLLPWDGLGSVPEKTCVSSLRATSRAWGWSGQRPRVAPGPQGAWWVSKGTGRGTKQWGRAGSWVLVVR